MFGIGVGVREGGLQYTGLAGGGGPYWTPAGGVPISGGRGGIIPGVDTGGVGWGFLPGLTDPRPKVGWKQPLGAGQWTGDPAEQQYFSQRIFGPESFADIADLADYRNLGAAGAQGVMGGWEDYLSGTVQPTLQEGLGTGFRTDMDPIRAEAMRAYQEEVIPQLKQQFAGQTGSFATDFLGATARAGSTMETQLGALQAQMDEAAANRRLAAMSQAGLPAELASLGLGVGAEYELAATPGGQQATLLQMLAGLQPTAAIARGNLSRGESGSQAYDVGFMGGNK
jgi:hypothetical protein